MRIIITDDEVRRTISLSTQKCYNPSMDTSQFPAILLLSLILTAVLTVIASAFLLQQYRRTVIRSMSARAAHIPASPIEEKSPDGENPFPLEFSMINQSKLEPNPRYIKLKAAARKKIIIYTLAGMGYALTMSSAFFFANQVEILPFRFITTFWTYLLPLLFVLHQVAYYDPKQRRRFSAGYFLVYLLLIFFASVPDFGAMANAFGLFWWINFAPFILSIAFLNRHTKAVAPLIMSFIFFIVVGVILALVYGIEPLSILLLKNESWLVNTYIALVRTLHPTALVPVSLLLLSVTGILLIGVFSVLLIRWLRRQYEQKKISDQSLLIDAIWLNFAIIHALLLSVDNFWWLFSGFGAFFLFKVISISSFSFEKKKISHEKVPQLLFLRVFSLGVKSQKLYQALTAFWRLGGNTLFITGPDLLTSTIEPHDFLDFLGKKLLQRFTNSEETLNRQIEYMDLIPDLDGLYRTHDFFCYDNTWKMALSRLTHESEVVVMDLRSFSAKNAGCTFEINALMNTVPLEQVIFIFDQSTDKNYMTQIMTNAWQSLNPNSPNHASAGKIKLFSYGQEEKTENLLQAITIAMSKT